MGEPLLVLRKDGAAYAIAASSVRALARRRGLVLVSTAEETLTADEVVGLDAAATVKPAGAAVRRFWRQPLLGLAMACSVPVVVLDPRRPPRTLRARKGKASNEHVDS